jgi:murein DD-endopeptidase MepM/ murein hydrolase activator NlpD
MPVPSTAPEAPGPREWSERRQHGNRLAPFPDPPSRLRPASLDKYPTDRPGEAYRKAIPVRRAYIRGIGVAVGGAAAALLLLVPTPAAAGGAVPGTVSVGSGRLAVRLAATASSAQVGALTNKSKVMIECQVTGDAVVKGRVRKTNKWDRLTNGQYVSDAYIERNTGLTVPVCPPAVVPAPVPDYPLTGPALSPELTRPTVPLWTTPVPTTAIGGFRTVTRPRHDGVDLPHARNTPIVSVAAGTVVTVRCNASTPSCDVDGSPTTTGCGWYVEVRHRGDVVTRYCHLVRRPEVAVGDVVTAGQLLGHVGTSGHSSGPHLHFEVHLGYPAARANAVDPVAFMQHVGAPL